MRSGDQHLSAEEIESLGKEEGLSGELGEQLRPAREHADACPACRRRLEVYPTTGAKLEKLWAPQAAQKGPDCPSIDIWFKLAGGLLSTAEQERYTAHAAQCDYCGPVLREVVQDFSEPATGNENAVVAELKRPEGKRRRPGAQAVDAAKAGPVAQVAHKVFRTGRWFGLPAWQFSAVALVVCGAIAFGLFRYGFFRSQDTVASVDQLLAQAYTEQRTIELRIPGAAYGPMRVERGAGKSHLSSPSALLDAEAVVKRQLERSPDDPTWLDARGRAELLEGDFDSAIETLKQSNQTAPDSISVRTDLATAYFERGEAEGRAQDYGAAADLLGTVLQESPNDQIALFNRAIVNERQALFPQAIADWENYLRIDPNSEWAEQAQSHLEKLRQKVLQHQKTSSESISSPSAFVQLVESRDPDVIARIDERIEDYQDVAIQDWLPALPNDMAGEGEGGNSVLRALSDLAGLLLERHSDRWLTDVIQQTKSSGFRPTALHLAHAVAAAAKGQLTEARSESRLAVGDLADVDRDAIHLRAEVEEVHALRGAQQGTPCLQESDEVAGKLRLLEYPWMLGQLSIDQCSCALMLGKFDLADSYATLSKKVAQHHNYIGLELRSDGLAASVRSDEGDISTAWAQDQAGLDRYWSGNFISPLRAQQFYDDLSYLAEDLEEWHSAFAFAEESARMLSLIGEREAEALARQHLARIAGHAGDPLFAARELTKSKDLLNSMQSTTNFQQSEETRADRLYSQIALAQIQIDQGRLEEADKLLRSAMPEIPSLTSFTIPQRFYDTYGNLLLKRYREPEAEETLLRGVEIADLSVKHISDPSSRYLWSQENSDVYRSLVYLELQKGDPARALAAWEWYKSASIGSARGSAESLKTFWRNNDLQDSLGGLVGQTVVSYAALPEGLAVWIVDDRGIHSQVIPIAPDRLAALGKEFTDLCSDWRSDLGAVVIAGRRLFDLLVSPIARYLDANRVLVIETDDIMGSLPFEALVTPDSHYLGQIYRIGFSTGLLYNDLLRSPSRVSADNAALVVSSTANVSAGEISLLPESDAIEEGEDIARRFTSAKELSGAEANVELLERALPSSEIWHFVGHAISSVDKEGLLLFGVPGIQGSPVLWGARRVTQRLFKRCKLVVLAACSTGKLYRTRVERHGELLNALLLAGVPQIVASRWDVDSGATRSLMNSFYAALLEGLSVPSALQLAEAELSSTSGMRHPFYWASFAAFGVFQ